MTQPVYLLTEKLSQYMKIRGDLRESSLEILERAVRWYVGLFGDCDIRRINYTMIDDYKSWLLAGRKPKTANTYLGMFKSFFTWLARRRYIQDNPFDGITMYKAVDMKFEIYTIDEIARILSIANSLWKLIISLALCGMRESEILNLIVRDIDLDNRRIKISPKKDSPNTWRWDIKDYHEAYIGFDESILKLLILRIEQLEDMPYVCLKPCYWRRNITKRNAGILRQRQRNNPWGNFSRDWRALQKRALVDLKRFHDLRGTFTTERYNAGYDIKELQYLLRHSAISTTARYIKTINEKKLVAKSGEFFAEHYATFNVS